MVVDEHTTGGGHPDQRSKHLARVNLDAGHRAARDLDDIEQVIADVDADHEEDLLEKAGDPMRADAMDVGGATEQLACLFVLDDTAAELEGGGDARGAGGSDTGDLGDLARGAAR